MLSPLPPTPRTPAAPPTPHTPLLPPTLPETALTTASHDPAREVAPPATNDAVPPEIHHPIFKKMFGEDFDKCNDVYTTQTSASPLWSARWEFIAPIKCSIYGAHYLSSATTKRIIELVTKEFRLLVDKKEASYRVVCLLKLVLIQDPNVKNGTSHKRAIHDLIHRRLQDWKSERYEKLYLEGSSIARTNALPYQDYAPNTKPAVIESLTTQARLSAACSLATNYSQGGLLKPDDFVTSKDGTRNNVRDVLHSKLPACVDQPPDSLDDPDDLPPLLHLTVTEDTVKQAAKNLQGAAGPDGLPGDLVKQWLTKYGPTSRKLRMVIADLTNLCANTTLSDSEAPLIAALLDSSLIALDKNPGVRPIGVGTIWRRLMAKTVLIAADPSIKLALEASQLCGTKGGIEAAIHAVNGLWDKHALDPEFGVLLLDAENAFCTLSSIRMLHTVRLRCPSLARFAFNTYSRTAGMCLRGSDGVHGEWFATSEGVTQGDPASMALYGLATLPLIDELKVRHPTLLHTWYADDGCGAGDLSELLAFHASVRELGPKYGYHLGDKCQVIVPMEALETATDLFSNTNVTVTTGHRYLGGYVGPAGEKEAYLLDKVNTLCDGVDRLAELALHKPHCAHVLLSKSLLGRGIFLQRIFDSASDAFGPMEEKVSKVFLPKATGLRHHEDTSVPSSRRLPDRRLSALPRQLMGLGIPNLQLTAESQYRASVEASAYLTQHITKLTDTATPFKVASHVACVKEARTSHRHRVEKLDKEMLATLRGDSELALTDAVEKKVSGDKSLGEWLADHPSGASDFLLSRDQFQVGVCVRYGKTPLYLPLKCDGCGADNNLHHALCCPHGGLIDARHNDVRDAYGELAIKALGKGCVRVEPPIFPPGSAEPGDAADSRGDLSAHNLWAPRVKAILDVTLSHTEAPSYLNRTADAVLRSRQQRKKKKYLKVLLDQRMHFTPFACSTSGQLAPEASASLKRIAYLLHLKWDRPLSVVTRWVNTRMSFAIVRAVTACVYGMRKHRYCGDLFEDGAGLPDHRDMIGH